MCELYVSKESETINQKFARLTFSVRSYVNISQMLNH